jgi:hypothetical protein
MAKKVRKPPGRADDKDPRAIEAFLRDLYDQNVLSNEVTIAVGPVASGATTTIVMTVAGAIKDQGQTVEYGLPSIWNTGLDVMAAYVSDDDEVTIVIRNPTGGSISIASAVYGARVRP